MNTKQQHQPFNQAVGASRVEPHDSLDDFPTPPWATRALLEFISFGPGMTAWEPAANRGYMAKVLRERFHFVHASDVHDYGYGFAVRDFLLPYDDDATVDWVITNPPFRLAEEFAHRAFEVSTCGVAMLVRLQWLEGINRWKNLFAKKPPARILLFTERLAMLKGRYDPKGDTKTAYAWIVWDVWEDEETRFTHPPSFCWIPPGTKARLFKPEDVLP